MTKHNSEPVGDPAGSDKTPRVNLTKIERDMIYVISNVEYPEERKLTPRPEDLLVFLNKARSAGFYAGHPRRMCIRRTPEASYGVDVPEVENRFIFSGPSDRTLPREVLQRLKKSYDWDYEIEDGKTKCATTGYMAIKYLEWLFPGEEITLVNFGFEVERSTYRCPWHNWRYEAKELAKFKHIYTADLAKHDRIEVAYCCDERYLERVRLSAESVMRHNPNAHITVVSPSPITLPAGFDNVVYDISRFNLRTTPRISAATYLRMFLPEIMPNSSKVIYLDGDTLCRGALRELWRLPVRFIGACHSHDFGRRQADEIGIKIYHIDAVMVMNLASLREMQFSTIAAWAATHSPMPKTRWYCEETVLNACFDYLVETIPLKWCYCVNRRYSTYKDSSDRENNNTAFVLHYIGGQFEAMKKDAAKAL